VISLVYLASFVTDRTLFFVNFALNQASVFNSIIKFLDVPILESPEALFHLPVMRLCRTLWSTNTHLRFSLNIQYQIS